MPENPDEVADFKFINNNNEPFTIETEGAHLKYIPHTNTICSIQY